MLNLSSAPDSNLTVSRRFFSKTHSEFVRSHIPTLKSFDLSMFSFESFVNREDKSLIMCGLLNIAMDQKLG